MSNTQTVDDTAVRNYIQWLTDPQSMRDDEAIAELEARIAEADPIEALTLHTQLAKLRVVDGEPFIKAFVENAKAWADANNVDVRAFREVHDVPAPVLRDAGFENVRRPSTTRVTKEDVVASVPKTGLFTVRDLENLSGASTVTVRETVQALVEDKVIQSRGIDPKHDGRGKAPVRYERKS